MPGTCNRGRTPHRNTRQGTRVGLNNNVREGKQFTNNKVLKVVLERLPSELIVPKPLVVIEKLSAERVTSSFSLKTKKGSPTREAKNVPPKTTSRKSRSCVVIGDPRIEKRMIKNLRMFTCVACAHSSRKLFNAQRHVSGCRLANTSRFTKDIKKVDQLKKSCARHTAVRDQYGRFAVCMAKKASARKPKSSTSATKSKVTKAVTKKTACSKSKVVCAKLADIKRKERDRRVRKRRAKEKKWIKTKSKTLGSTVTDLKLLVAQLSPKSLKTGTKRRNSSGAAESRSSEPMVRCCRASGEAMYKCTFCSCANLTPSNLKRHMNAVHKMRASKIAMCKQLDHNEDVLTETTDTPQREVVYPSHPNDEHSEEVLTETTDTPQREVAYSSPPNDKLCEEVLTEMTRTSPKEVAYPSYSNDQSFVDNLADTSTSSCDKFIIENDIADDDICDEQEDFMQANFVDTEIKVEFGNVNNNTKGEQGVDKLMTDKERYNTLSIDKQQVDISTWDQQVTDQNISEVMTGDYTSFLFCPGALNIEDSSDQQRRLKDETYQSSVSTTTEFSVICYDKRLKQQYVGDNVSFCNKAVDMCVEEYETPGAKYGNYYVDNNVIYETDDIDNEVRQPASEILAATREAPYNKSGNEPSNINTCVEEIAGTSDFNSENFINISDDDGDVCGLPMRSVVTDTTSLSVGVKYAVDSAPFLFR